MRPIIPLVSFTMAAACVGYSAHQFSGVATTITNPEEPMDARPPMPVLEARAPRLASGRPAEPVHQSLIRCLTDVDDLLDTIRDPASFAVAKPKILARMRQQAAYAAEHSHQGMSNVSPQAAAELRKAVNRHAESLARATKAVPGVAAFFEMDVAAVLNGK